jgi:hypothetical protein
MVFEPVCECSEFVRVAQVEAERAFDAGGKRELWHVTPYESAAWPMPLLLLLVARH